MEKKNNEKKKMYKKPLLKKYKLGNKLSVSPTMFLTAC